MSFRPCILVPAFNHAEGATALAEKLMPLGLQTIVVNDGSDRHAAEILHGLARQFDWIEVLDHPENRGKGAAVVTGLRAALARGFSHALQIDADGQHDSRDIPHFLSRAEADPLAVVTGYPIFDSSVPKVRLLARYLTHFWVWVETLSFTIRDSLCGFRVYPLAPVVDLIDRVPLGTHMDFDPEILVHLHWEGTAIISVPTKVIYPADGKSHFRLWKDNCLISKMHTKLVFGMLWRLLTLRAGRFGAAPHSAPASR